MLKYKVDGVAILKSDIISQREHIQRANKQKSRKGDMTWLQSGKDTYSDVTELECKSLHEIANGEGQGQKWML